MKLAAFLLIIMFSVTVRAQPKSLSYNDSIVLKKTFMTTNILPSDLLELHRDFDFDGLRMIAGKRDILESKLQKKTSWAEGLRSRLKGTSGQFRF